MACIISGAVCCVLITASMAGVALGYNYSLAEFIDLKETNVSVYMKRGVFDDDIADNMEWRRSGVGPSAQEIEASNVRSELKEMKEDEIPKSARRLDDSVFHSDDHNKFEGALMKLTAKSDGFTFSSSTTTETTTPDMMVQVVAKYPPGSPEQLKTIHSIINARRKAASGTLKPNFPVPIANPDNQVDKSKVMEVDERYLPNMPAQPGSARKMMVGSNNKVYYANRPYELVPKDSLRAAVPGAEILDENNWMIPKQYPNIKVHSRDPFNPMDYDDVVPTYLPAVTPRPAPVRPNKAKIKQVTIPVSTTPAKIPQRTKEDSMQKSIDEELDPFKEKLLDKFEPIGFRNKGVLGKSDDEYDDEIRGLPVRRKRDLNQQKRGVKKRHKKIEYLKRELLSNTLQPKATTTITRFEEVRRNITSNMDNSKSKVFS